MERACRRAQLSQSLSSGVSSSPLTQPLRASEYLVWTKVQGFPSGASGRARAAFLWCRMQRAVWLLFTGFSITQFWSFITPESSFSTCLSERLEQLFTPLFLYLYNYECNISCSAPFSSVCKATEKRDIFTDKLKIFFSK